MFIKERTNQQFGILYARGETPVKGLYWAVTDEYGSVINENYLEVPCVSLEELSSVIIEMICQFPSLSSLIIGLPGVVDAGLIYSCDFPLLTGLALKDILEEHFSLKVRLENDVNCMAQGYHSSKGGGKPDNMVYLYLPRMGKAGAGLILNGGLYRGFRNFAGEVNWILPKKGQDPAGYGASLVLTLKVLFDPELIVLSGYEFTPEVKKELDAILDDITPTGHKPVMVFEDDMHDSYFWGLVLLSRKYLLNSRAIRLS